MKRRISKMVLCFYCDKRLKSTLVNILLSNKMTLWLFLFCTKNTTWLKNSSLKISSWNSVMFSNKLARKSKNSKFSSKKQPSTKSLMEIPMRFLKKFWIFISFPEIFKNSEYCWKLLLNLKRKENIRKLWWMSLNC